MSSTDGAAIVTDKRQLVEWLETGCKPRDQWRIGTEHEKFTYDKRTLRRLSYHGSPGIREFLLGMVGDMWSPVYERDNIIALKCQCSASITLEPGGQVELSGAPLKTIHETCAEVDRHLKQVKAVCEKMNVGMTGFGFDPQWQRKDVPWMPKGRYDIMKRYMPTRGGLGLDMMSRTCTVQVNLDFASEADMVRKMRLSLALQPIATALFANSPFRDGQATDFLSLRSHCWTDTDPDRCGMLPFVFEDGFGFERWVEYMLDVPMYFLHRGEEYQDMTGRSFRDFLAGRLPGCEGEYPTLEDWSDHLTTAFPEVRLKRFLEMRGADAGPRHLLCALPALWVGLLYDETALSEAEALVADWTFADMEQLRAEVPKRALKARIQNRTAQEVAKEVLAIARRGLERRQQLDWEGRTEAHFLIPLETIAEKGVTLAEEHLTLFNSKWQGNITKIYEECSYF